MCFTNPSSPTMKLKVWYKSIKAWNHGKSFFPLLVSTDISPLHCYSSNDMLLWEVIVANTQSYFKWFKRIYLCISFSWQCHTFTTQAESLNNSFYAQSQLLNWILQDLMSNSVSCLCTGHNDRNKSCNASPRWICISPPKFQEKPRILFSNISDFVNVSYEQHVRSQPAKIHDTNCIYMSLERNLVNPI